MVQQLRHWCRVGACAVCDVCGGLEPRSLNAKDLRVSPEETILCGRSCAAGYYFRPLRAHVPPALRDLTRTQMEALSPLSLHQGDHNSPSAGYGHFSRFTRFRCKPAAFGERCADLPGEERHAVCGVCMYDVQRGIGCFRI